jgi:hypothetical protein
MDVWVGRCALLRCDADGCARARCCDVCGERRKKEEEEKESLLEGVQRKKKTMGKASSVSQACGRRAEGGTMSVAVASDGGGGGGGMAMVGRGAINLWVHAAGPSTLLLCYKGLGGRFTRESARTRPLARWLVKATPRPTKGTSGAINKQTRRDGGLQLPLRRRAVRRTRGRRGGEGG